MAEVRYFQKQYKKLTIFLASLVIDHIYEFHLRSGMSPISRSKQGASVKELRFVVMIYGLIYEDEILLLLFNFGSIESSKPVFPPFLGIDVTNI